MLQSSPKSFISLIYMYLPLHLVTLDKKSFSMFHILRENDNVQIDFLSCPMGLQMLFMNVNLCGTSCSLSAMTHSWFTVGDPTVLHIILTVRY